jgi:hypothetical protein
MLRRLVRAGRVFLLARAKPFLRARTIDVVGIADSKKMRRLIFHSFNARQLAARRTNV